MSPPTDPSVDPQVPQRPPMPSTPQLSHISLSRPLEPHTFEELVHASRREKFTTPSPDRNDGKDTEGEIDHEGRKDKDVVENQDRREGQEGPAVTPPFNDTSTGDMAPRKHVASTNHIRQPYPTSHSSLTPYAESITENLDLPSLTLAGQKPKLIARKRVGSSGQGSGSHVAEKFQEAADGFSEAAESPTVFQKFGEGKIADRDADHGTDGEREQQQHYFGSDSKMNEESLRSSPGTVVGFTERAQHENRSEWDSSSASEYGDHRAGAPHVTQGLGLRVGTDWGIENTGQCEGNSSDAWGIPAEYSNSQGSVAPPRPSDGCAPLTANDTPPIKTWVRSESTSEPSGSTGGSKWERTPYQQFKNSTGEANTGWGTLREGNAPTGGWNNTNNNNPNAWGCNADDGSVFNSNPKQRSGHVRSRHPSLNQSAFQYQPGAEPSRPLSEATVRPFVQPHPHPTETHTHYHHHTYDTHRPQNQTSAPQANEREYIRELREQNSTQAALMTEQRTHIAIIENDLKHMKKDKESAVNASMFIAQNLGSAFSGQGSTSRRVIEERDSPDRDDEVRKLKLEVERLTKDNEVLENFLNESIKHFEGSQSSTEDDPKDAQTSSAAGKRKGKERLTDSSDHPPAKSTALASAMKKKKRAPGGLRAAYEKDKELTRLQKAAAEPFDEVSQKAEKSSLGSDTETKGVSGWDESFSSDISTVPNSPILNASSASSASNSQKMNTMSDVGLLSLDESLDGEMEIHQPTPISSKKFEPLSTQYESQMKAMVNFACVPAPSVLKTGFDINNAKRGAEYDHLAPQAEQHRGGLNNFSRFDITSTANPYANTTMHKIWSSSEEQNMAVIVHQSQIHRDGIRYPDIFRYGIEYVPEAGDENYLRTVSISNLPFDIELRDVLARVRGGQISNAILMDTRSVLGGMKSAMVFFLEDDEAAAFVDYTSSNPIAFGSEDNTTQALVTLIQTPTYPLSQGMIRRMKADKIDTRCLTIRNFPIELSLSKLQSDIACRNGHRADNLVEIFLDKNNTLHLEFSSIHLAGSSFAILTNFSLYRGLEVSFAPDPCTGLLQELELPVPPRPLMIPRHNITSPQYEMDRSSTFSNVGRIGDLTQIGGEVITQRKCLQALTTQPVIIPSFSGTNLKSSSWADEVIEESDSANNSMVSNPTMATGPSYYYEHNPEHTSTGELPHTHSFVPPNSPVDGVLPMDAQLPVGDVADALSMEKDNVLTQETLTVVKKAHAGLSQSMHATEQPKQYVAQEEHKGRKLMRSITEEDSSDVDLVEDEKIKTAFNSTEGKEEKFTIGDLENPFREPVLYSGYIGTTDLPEMTPSLGAIKSSSRVPSQKPTSQKSLIAEVANKFFTKNGLEAEKYSLSNVGTVNRPSLLPEIGQAARFSSAFNALLLAPPQVRESYTENFQDYGQTPTKSVPGAVTMKRDANLRRKELYKKDPDRFDRMISQGGVPSDGPFEGQTGGWLQPMNMNGTAEEEKMPLQWRVRIKTANREFEAEKAEAEGKREAEKREAEEREAEETEAEQKSLVAVKVNDAEIDLEDDDDVDISECVHAEDLIAREEAKQGRSRDASDK